MLSSLFMIRLYNKIIFIKQMKSTILLVSLLLIWNSAGQDEPKELDEGDYDQFYADRELQIGREEEEAKFREDPTQDEKEAKISFVEPEKVVTEERDAKPDYQSAPALDTFVQYIYLPIWDRKLFYWPYWNPYWWRYCYCWRHYIYAVDWSGSMRWEDIYGITGYQKANQYIMNADIASERHTLFTHTDGLAGQTQLWYYYYSGAMSLYSSPIASLPSGDTNYNVAMQRSIYLAYRLRGWKTCIIFVGDGTEEYHPGALAAFQWYLWVWRWWFRCPICIRCVLTHTTVTDYYWQTRNYTFKQMCERLNADIRILGDIEPGQGWGQFGSAVAKSGGAEAAYALPDPDYGG